MAHRANSVMQEGSGGGGVLYLVYTKCDGTGLITAATASALDPGANGNPGADGKLFCYNATTGLWE